MVVHWGFQALPAAVNLNIVKRRVFSKEHCNTTGFETFLRDAIISKTFSEFFGILEGLTVCQLSCRSRGFPIEREPAVESVAVTFKLHYLEVSFEYQFRAEWVVS